MPITQEASNLLLEIHHCPTAQAILRGGFAEFLANPCRKVVNAQFQQSNLMDVRDWHAPEPWSGNLEQCKLLFISSNPAFDHRDHYPLLRRDVNSPDPMRFFDGRYSDPEFSTPELRAVHRSGGSHSVPFWRDIEQLGATLMAGRENLLRSGLAALTEVVHCKSKKAVGVDEAAETCTGKYLGRTLSLAKQCKVVVVLGKHAERAMRAAGHLTEGRAVGQSERDGRHYAVTCHPDYIGRLGAPATLTAFWTDDELASLQAALAA